MGLLSRTTVTPSSGGSGGDLVVDGPWVLKDTVRSTRPQASQIDLSGRQTAADDGNNEGLGKMCQSEALPVGVRR
jgi:hypothetical protein